MVCRFSRNSTPIFFCILKDMERYFPLIKCEYLSPDEIDTYRKKVLHPINSARLFYTLFQNVSFLTKNEINKIYHLIIHHDAPPSMDQEFTLSTLFALFPNPLHCTIAEMTNIFENFVMF